MIAFLSQIPGTIIVGLIVAGIVAAITVKLIRDQRQGQCPGCNCGCGGCNNRLNCAAK